MYRSPVRKMALNAEDAILAAEAAYYCLDRALSPHEDFGYDHL
jgi:hypothetical protein